MYTYNMQSTLVQLLFRCYVAALIRVSSPPEQHGQALNSTFPVLTTNHNILENLERNPRNGQTSVDKL